MEVVKCRASVQIQDQIHFPQGLRQQSDSGEEMRLKDWVQQSEMVALRRVVVTIARPAAEL